MTNIGLGLLAILMLWLTQHLLFGGWFDIKVSFGSKKTDQNISIKLGDTKNKYRTGDNLYDN